MVQEYAIKIGNKYFKEFIYTKQNRKGRYGGNTGNGGVYVQGDIEDIYLTEDIELTLSRRCLGDKIKLIYDIDKFKNKKVSIIPI